MIRIRIRNAGPSGRNLELFCPLEKSEYFIMATFLFYCRTKRGQHCLSQGDYQTSGGAPHCGTGQTGGHRSTTGCHSHRRRHASALPAVGSDILGSSTLRAGSCSEAACNRAGKEICLTAQGETAGTGIGARCPSSESVFGDVESIEEELEEDEEEYTYLDSRLANYRYPSRVRHQNHTES